MRRFAWRLALILVLLVSVLAAPVGVKAFNRACDGSLEGLRYLSGVREQLQTATAPPPTPSVPPTATPQPPTATPTRQPTLPPAAQVSITPTPTPRPTATPTLTPTPIPTPAGPTLGQRALEQAGLAGDTALGLLVWVKQSDAVAYPLHIVTAHALDAARCPEDAVRLQWLKAGLHASRAGQPEQVASALVARANTPEQLTDLRRVVRIWTERAWDNEPLRQVLAALDARA
ncbi:MAG: hypothetical protein IT306_21785 [Chloroflexi bacterium]|nr:hypothetical protein [Chloroflexota bacterium]